MMCIFHLIMVNMHILSKRFKDAGLRDVLIHSSVIAEGSIERALCGKIYNRGIRIYKLMYEVIMRKTDEYTVNNIDESVLEKVKEFSGQGITDIDFENILLDENMNSYHHV